MRIRMGASDCREAIIGLLLCPRAVHASSHIAQAACFGGNRSLHCFSDRLPEDVPGAGALDRRVGS